MSFGFKADPSGLYGTVTIDGVDSLVINKDGSIVGNNFVDSNGQLLSAGATNHIIDGDFNFWHEGTSQTDNGYGSDTMWQNNNSGSTKVHTQQLFALGQIDVPGNPRYFSRTVVTSVAGASNYTLKRQHSEDIVKLSGKTVTLSFYAKADSAKDIALEFVQRFGTGGSPSSPVEGIGGTTVSLSTSWKKFIVTAYLPSISGKTLGTDGNEDMYTQFWFDAGTTYDARTGSLGQQSGTFDIARVRLVEGEVDGDHIIEVHGEVADMVGRYFETSYPVGVTPGLATNVGAHKTGTLSPWLLMAATVGFLVLKRGAPTITLYSTHDGASSKMTEYTVASAFVKNMGPSSLISCESSFQLNTDGTADVDYQIRFQWTADARL